HDPVVGIVGLKTICQLTPLPIFAIGGITLDNAKDVIRAGANGVAVISAVLKASDVAQAVNDFVLRLSTPAAPTS
ncbi:MAG: thiamine phosphate synthase, partial [Nitrospira sp.]